MTAVELQTAIERLAADPEATRDRALPAVEQLLVALESGLVRAAEPADGGWRVNAWVKQGILLGFRLGRNESIPMPPVFHFRDRDTFPTQDPAALGRDVRIVPGGSTVRRGAYLGDGVVIMPPAYVNVGAWVGDGSMVDSHSLVGSCAQLGRGVHLSAAAQVGGVLEPVGAVPVVVEDDAFVGGGCGIYEGVQVGAGAVLAPGVVLSGSVPVFDLVHERAIRAEHGAPLRIPAGAVVVPGSRPAGTDFARSNGLHVQAPLIVKYRDSSTAAAVVLEEALR